MRVDPKDIVGERFKRLLIVSHDGGGRTAASQEYTAKCDCGNTVRVLRESVLSGHKGSCGCLRRETAANNRTKHGETIRFGERVNPTPEWMAWMAMIDRCRRETHPAFHNYGGRGIKVCDEWLLSFDAFLLHVGRRPSNNHSLDRIDNNGHYEPGNVRWATKREQGRNTRHTRVLECRGRKQSVTAWAEEMGISKGLICGRLKMGWSVEAAIETPVNKTRSDPKIPKDTVNLVRSLWESGTPMKDVAAKAGVAITSAWRIVKRQGAHKDA